MKKALASIVSIVMVIGTSVPAVAEPQTAAPREKAVMLYFTKSFGSEQQQNRSPLAFGLRLQQSASFDATRPIALLDARYSLGGRKTFALAGLNAFESTNDSSQESSGQSSVSSDNIWKEHPYLTSVAVVLAVLGIMCGTETLICEGGRRYRQGELDTLQLGD